MALAALLFGGLAAGVVAVYAGAGAGADVVVEELAIATAAPVQRPPPPAEVFAPPRTGDGTPSPSTPPSAPLDELRASDAFVEFAEARRARFAPGADRAYDAFGWDGADGNYYRFSNASTLWNEVVAPIRDDLLQLGTEFHGEQLGQMVEHGYIGIKTREVSDPQVVTFYGTVVGAGGDVHLVTQAVEIRVTLEGPDRGTGRLVTRMPSYSVALSNFTTWEEMAVTTVRPHLKAWIEG